MIVHDGVTPIDSVQVRRLWRQSDSQYVASGGRVEARHERAGSGVRATHDAMALMHERVMGFHLLEPLRRRRQAMPLPTTAPIIRAGHQAAADRPRQRNRPHPVATAAEFSLDDRGIHPRRVVRRRWAQTTCPVRRQKSRWDRKRLQSTPVAISRQSVCNSAQALKRSAKSLRGFATRWQLCHRVASALKNLRINHLPTASIRLTIADVQGTRTRGSSKCQNNLPDGATLICISELATELRFQRNAIG